MHASLVSRRRMDDAPGELTLPGMGTSVGPAPGSLESNRPVLSPNRVGDDLGDHAAPPDEKAHLPPHLARADRSSPAPSPASLPLSHLDRNSPPNISGPPFGVATSAGARHGNGASPRGHSYPPPFDNITPDSHDAKHHPPRQQRDEQPHPPATRGPRDPTDQQGSPNNGATLVTANTDDGFPSPPNGETAHRYDAPEDEATQFADHSYHNGATKPATVSNRADAVVELKAAAAAAAGADADAHSGRTSDCGDQLAASVPPQPQSDAKQQFEPKHDDEREQQSRGVKRSLPLEDNAINVEHVNDFLPGDVGTDEGAVDSDHSWEESEEHRRKKGARTKKRNRTKEECFAREEHEVAAAQPSRKRGRQSPESPGGTNERKRNNGSQHQMLVNKRRTSPQSSQQKPKQLRGAIGAPHHNVDENAKSEIPCAEIGPCTGVEHKIVVSSSHMLIDDGLRWRKYGQKQVKGSSFPRSYYKCTSAARSISKLIEQQSSDPERYSITYVSDSSEATELNRRLDGISEISIVEGHTV